MQLAILLHRPSAFSHIISNQDKYYPVSQLDLLRSSSYNLTTSQRDMIAIILEMAKGKISNSKREKGTCFMFRSFHKDISKAVSPGVTCTWISKSVSDGGVDREYFTRVIGNFRRMNPAYSTNGWSSKKVALQIRGYAQNGYNAVIFN